ncbi:hypothetical protein BDQ12DRAFT_678406 [Crucibulum laeve]|uniref:Secreted protein n=1 Tax=Crucibulum laeve TaxID=68775 RepID=A0A5C3MKN7_9AGAR|nr:hypothetical protein BDQ12DRAFT_678406 [Crucibulum laeve]
MHHSLCLLGFFFRLNFLLLQLLWQITRIPTPREPQRVARRRVALSCGTDGIKSQQRGVCSQGRARVGARGARCV